MTAEDDFSSILGYRLRALHFKGTEIFLPDMVLLKTVSVFTWLSTAWPYILKVLTISGWSFYCCRRFQFDTWLSPAWLIFEFERY